MKQPRLLEANEISCRVQSVTRNNGAINYWAAVNGTEFETEGYENE